MQNEQSNMGKSFHDGHQETRDLPRASRPHSSITKVNVNTVATVHDKVCHLSVRQLKEDLNIPKTTIHRILKDKLHVCTSWVPHFLTSYQLQQHLEACNENLVLSAEDPDILQKVIMMDESWVHYHEPHTKWKGRLQVPE